MPSHLKEHEGVAGLLQAYGCEMLHSDDGATLAEGEGVARQPEGYGSCRGGKMLVSRNYLM